MGTNWEHQLSTYVKLASALFSLWHIVMIGALLGLLYITLNLLKSIYVIFNLLILPICV